MVPYADWLSMKLRILISGALLAWGPAVLGGGFVNLDFEDYAPHEGGFSADVPGWGGLNIDPIPLDGASFGLVTTNNEYQTPLQGEAALFLGTGILFYTNEIQVSQTGDVPTNAARIRFLTTLAGVSATMSNMSLTASAPEEPTPGVYRYTTDIQTLAGRTAVLTFTLGWSEYGRYQLDQIEFLDESGAVIWPVPGPGPAICLEDFHAATLNPTLWDVATFSGQSNACSISSGMLRIDVPPPSAPFETEFRYRAALRGDWDVRMDYYFQPILSLANSNNPGCFGVTLAADFGPAATARAGVGQMILISNQARSYVMDWGQGPANFLEPTAMTGVFRLVRTGWEVAGYAWNAGSNGWQVIGSMDGYTDETARVGLKVWSTGAFSGKTALIKADNLLLAGGQMSLDGLAIKTFGLDEGGAPAINWDAVGIAPTNKYVVMRATNIPDSAWTPVSSGIVDAGGETNWTGSATAAGSGFYRIEVAP